MSFDKLTKHEQLALVLQSEHFAQITDIPDGENMTFKSVVPLPGGRSQLVFVQANDVTYQLSSPFAEVADFSAERALNVNFTLFGVSVVFGRYSLVLTNLVEMFSLEPFLQSFATLANFADNIEQMIGGADEL
jgi:hypothetical protein